MGDPTGIPGPLWFRVLFVGVILGTTEVFVVAALWGGPGTDTGFFDAAVFLGLIAATLLGAGFWLGWRVRFRWKGWREEEARRNEARTQQLQRGFAKLGFDVEIPPPRSKP